jgi:hypothetical protein
VVESATQIATAASQITSAIPRICNCVRNSWLLMAVLFCLCVYLAWLALEVQRLKKVQGQAPQPQEEPRQPGPPAAPAPVPGEWVYITDQDSLYLSDKQGVVHLVRSCQGVALSCTSKSVCKNCLRTVRNQGGKLKKD